MVTHSLARLQHHWNGLIVELCHHLEWPKDFGCCGIEILFCQHFFERNKHGSWLKMAEISCVVGQNYIVRFCPPGETRRVAQTPFMRWRADDAVTRNFSIWCKEVLSNLSISLRAFSAADEDHQTVLDAGGLVRSCVRILFIPERYTVEYQDVERYKVRTCELVLHYQVMRKGRCTFLHLPAPSLGPPGPAGPTFTELFTPRTFALPPLSRCSCGA